MPILYIRDKDTREIIHIEEGFSSLVWTERYQEAGDFVLDIPLAKANFDVYKRGNYISFDESNESMIIETVSQTENFGSSEEEPLLEISGRTLSSLLTRRVNASKVFSVHDGKLKGTRGPDMQSGLIEYSGKISQVLSSVMEDDLINPKIPSYSWEHKEGGEWVPGYSSSRINRAIVSYDIFDFRKIPNVSYSSMIPDSFDNDIYKTYDKINTLYDIFVHISRNNMVGFRSYFDGSNIVIQSYKGTDRTVNQKTLTPIVFDPIMDNITYVNYYEDATNYKSSGFIYTDSPLAYAWKDTDFDSFVIFQGYGWASDSSSNAGIDRYEVPVDVRSDASILDLYSSKNVSDVLPEGSQTDSETENQYVSWSEYYDMLRNKVLSSGTSSFEEEDYELVQTSEGSIDPLVRYTFGKDYFLGDIVTITNNYGVVMDCYIDEVVRSYDTNGCITTPNFKNMLDYDYGEEET